MTEETDVFLIAIIWIMALGVALYALACIVDETEEEDDEEEEDIGLDLSKRMKSYETYSDKRIMPYESFVIRCDGKSFSKFTRGFGKRRLDEESSAAATPFDPVFVSAMLRTACSAAEELGARTFEVHSDEISFYFPAICTREEYENGTSRSEHSHGGRVFKLTSLAASYSSVYFNQHLNVLINDPENIDHYTPEFINIVSCRNCIFDGRAVIFPVGRAYDVVNYMIWRARDCSRNAISTYGRKFFSKCQLSHRNSLEIIEMMKREYDFDWDRDVPSHIKYGVYGKKQSILLNNSAVMYRRNKITTMSFKMTFSLDMVNLLQAKTWPLWTTSGDPGELAAHFGSTNVYSVAVENYSTTTGCSGRLVLDCVYEGRGRLMADPKSAVVSNDDDDETPQPIFNVSEKMRQKMKKSM